MSVLDYKHCDEDCDNSLIEELSLSRTSVFIVALFLCN